MRTTNGTTTQMSFDAFDQLITDGDITDGYDALDRVISRNNAGTAQGFRVAALSDPHGDLLATFTATQTGTSRGIGEKRVFYFACSDASQAQRNVNNDASLPAM
jgi:hypothetical protein